VFDLLVEMNSIALLHNPRVILPMTQLTKDLLFAATALCPCTGYHKWASFSRMSAASVPPVTVVASAVISTVRDFLQ
jgi:hypothetical protein